MAYGYGYQQYAPPARYSAPASVHVAAALQYLSGLLALLVTALFTIGALSVANTDISTNMPGVGDLGKQALYVGIAISAVVALIFFVIGRKLQTGRQWARILVLVLSFLSLAGAAYDFFVTRAPASLSGTLFPLLWVILLNTSAARSWFRYRTY